MDVVTGNWFTSVTLTVTLNEGFHAIASAKTAAASCKRIWGTRRLGTSNIRQRMSIAIPSP